MAQLSFRVKISHGAIRYLQDENKSVYFDLIDIFDDIVNINYVTLH